MLILNNVFTKSICLVLNIESNKRDACFVVSEYLPSALKESLLECIFSDKQKSNKPNKNNTDQNNKVKHKEIQHDEVPHKVKKVCHLMVSTYRNLKFLILKI